MPPLRSVAHFDLDAFFVSVERLKDPSLCGKPVIVGGGDRGVVATCSYEARRFGVHSAMPIRQAKSLCPGAIIVRGDMESYSKYSRLVTDVIASEVPLFQKSSIDEFYVEMTGMDKFFGCLRHCENIKSKIARETGLTISFGLGSSKLISKIATSEIKPNGQLSIPYGGEKAFLWPLPVGKMPMVGDKTAALLNSMGIATIGDVGRMTPEMVTAILGKNGTSLWHRANGIDPSPVISYREQKSIGTENTFASDTADPAFLHRELLRMTGQVSFGLRSSNRLAGCVTVKTRYSNFDTFTRQLTIPYTAADHILFKAVKDLFQNSFDRRHKLRLIGVRVSHLVPGNHQIDLFNDTPQMLSLYQSIDSIKTRYGEDLLKRAGTCTTTLKKRYKFFAG